MGPHRCPYRREGKKTPMQQRFNNMSFQTLAFVMEHDYAGHAAMPGKTAAPYRANLDRMDFEQRVPLMSQLYEDHFVRNAVEYLAHANDPRVELTFGAQALCPEIMSCGFFVRRFGNDLVVTRVCGETRVNVGERIVRVNGYDVADYARQARPVLGDATGDVTHELWNTAMAFSRHFDVLCPDGSMQRLKTEHYRVERPVSKAAVEMLPGGIVLVRPSTGVARELQAALGTAGACGVIIDLREVTSLDEDTALAILPLLIHEPVTLEELPGYGPLHLWCSPNNCRALASILTGAARAMEAQGQISDAKKTRAQAAEICDMAGQGFCLVDMNGGSQTPIVPLMPHVPVAVIVDTATSSLAENLTRIAERFGRATLVGRATRGSLDYALPITVRLDAAYSVTYPAAMSLEAFQGERINGIGIVPQVCVPWTPEHLSSDRDLERALACVG